MTPQEIETLLAAEESETFERKQGFEEDEIRKAIIAFANDLYGRGCGCLVVGQARDKTITGLKISGDAAQQRITDIARNSCSPAIPVSVQIYEKNDKRVAIVEVRKSPARPHFAGKAWVRMGCTTRLATDAEIILMRAVEENRKVALLKRWMDTGMSTVIFWQLPAPGQSFDRAPRVERAQLLDVDENWVVLDMGGIKRTFPFSEFDLGFDFNEGLPQIRYHGRMGT